MEIFISYGREEGVSEFALELYSKLKEAGLDPWLDIKNIGPGEDWPKAIGQALSRCKAFVAIITKKYVAESQYCEKELCVVANQRGKKIFPVLYHDHSDWKDLKNGEGVNLMISNINWCMYCNEGDACLVALIKAIYEFVRRDGNEDDGRPLNMEMENVTHDHPPKGLPTSGNLKSKPTMAMLNLLTTRSGKEIKIILRLSCDWEKLGHYLDFDDAGDTVMNIKRMQQGFVCLTEVLQLWLREESRNLKYKPATWETLISLVKDCGHSDLAQELKSHFRY